MEGDNAITYLKEMSNNICEPFRSAIQWIPPGSIFSLTQLNYWVTIPWNNRGSRVTLAGDAAHSMLPSKSSCRQSELTLPMLNSRIGRGQGMNHALDDADKLVAQFVRVNRGTPLGEALKTYEDELFERGPKAVLGSLEDAEGIRAAGKGEKIRFAGQGLKA